MRTSKASQDTAKVFQALSSTRRQTRNSSLNSSGLRSFAYNAAGVKEEDIPPVTRASPGTDSSLSSADTADIEDLMQPRPKRQKRNPSGTSPRAPSRAARNPTVTKEEPEAKPSAPARARRMPARKTRDAAGEVVVEPPSNSEGYKMREDNPTAPVDTMGCAELYWRASSPQDRRFQTLIALMLSSQTKDTVTAVAMQRLHTELGEGAEAAETKVKSEGDEAKIIEKDSTLNERTFSRWNRAG
ncbi:hypothetical protein N7470_002017 [Penicillium chermesinum]|nr:hypothetical protein N7470_002017 [Penicillium chermesinum]